MSYIVDYELFIYFLIEHNNEASLICCELTLCFNTTFQELDCGTAIYEIGSLGSGVFFMVFSFQAWDIHRFKSRFLPGKSPGAISYRRVVFCIGWFSW